MRTLVFANQKGGVGKTAIACHAAFHLADRGQRVLVLDLDAQGNASKTLRAHASGVAASRLFADAPVELPDADGIRLVEADTKLTDLERADPAVIAALSRRLEQWAPRFDWCVIDCPPTLGLRMSAALIVADHVVAPIELDGYSLDGIARMLQTVYGVRQRFNPRLAFVGMLANRVNPHSLQQKQALTELLASFPGYTLPARIGIRSAIPEALDAGVPVWRLKKSSAVEAGREIQAALNLIVNRICEESPDASRPHSA